MLKRIITLIICGMIVTNTAFAAKIYSVDYNLQTSTVNIVGNTAKPFQTVTLEVLKKNVKSENVTSWDLSKIYRVDETQADENGNFQFVFRMDAETDNYITRIHTDSIEEDCIVYVKYSEFIDAFEEINTASDAETILNAIQTKGNLLGMSKDYYNYLSNEQRKSVARQILNKKNENSSKLFLSSSELLNAYNKSTAIVALSASKTNTNLNSLDIIKNNAELLGVKDSDAYGTYKDFTDSEKNTIASTLASKQYDNVDEFLNEFVLAVVLLEIKDTENYINLYNLLADNNSVLQIDFTDYNKLDSYKKSVVLRKIAGMAYTNINDLRTSFYNAIKESYSTTVTQTVTGGGGGGGGTISVQVPSSTNNGNGGSTGKASPFNDVESSNWAAASIISLYEKGIIHGKGEGQFCPAEAVKREEFIKMLIAGIGSDITDAKDSFSDVDINMWYSSYITQAYSMGIVNGISGNRFGVGQDITREDLMVMLYRAISIMGIELPTNNQKTFKDENSISDYAKEAVMVLTQAGIINGNENGEVEPKKSATRAETARILNEFLMYIN